MLAFVEHRIAGDQQALNVAEVDAGGVVHAFGAAVVDQVAADQTVLARGHTDATDAVVVRDIAGNVDVAGIGRIQPVDVDARVAFGDDVAGDGDVAAGYALRHICRRIGEHADGRSGCIADHGVAQRGVLHAAVEAEADVGDV